MSNAGWFFRTAALACAVSASAISGAPAASAQEVEGVTREAARHFQRGVTLYGEADYRAALVEFKRAYELAPNAAVLYNVGETEYQLQDYAGALTTFKRYLLEASPTETHRPEVESNIEVLRARVGRLGIQTTPPGADISIDDQAIGKTPLAEPTFVSIGHRKVVATWAGRSAVSRYIDVAAEDNVSITLALPTAETGASSSSRQPLGASAVVRSTPREGPWATLRIVGWIATGAFAAGAVTFGILANKESNDLKRARSSYPTTSSALNHDANLTTTFAVATDTLAAVALIVGGITLYSTLSSASSPPRHGRADIQVMLSPYFVRAESTF
jgi:tetratricopeptide (TPR) repeat protein